MHKRQYRSDPMIEKWKDPRWMCTRVTIFSFVVLAAFWIFSLNYVRNHLQMFRDDISSRMALSRNPGSPRTAPTGSCPEDFRDWKGNYVFITVKTTASNHGNRVNLLMKTWIPEALRIRGKNNESLVKVSIVSDKVDRIFVSNVGGRMVESRCPSSHNKTDLCCKLATEFDLYLAEKDLAPWFCHVDDDNYINIYNLLHELGKYNPNYPVYLGKSSRGRVKLKDVISILPMPLYGRAVPQFVSFSFATGGAGFCLSAEAVQRIKLKVSRIFGGPGLEGLCRKIPGLADDVAVGYVTGYHNVTLTEVPNMHSHLETLSSLSTQSIRDAVTLSYTKYRSYENVVGLPPDKTLPKKDDPTRFLSLHRFLQSKC